MISSTSAGARRLVTLAAAFAAVLGAGTAPAAAQAPTEVTYVQPNPSAINSFPVYVAIGEGYFEEEGLSVQTESVNGSGAILQALAAGQAQFGRPGPAPVLQARARGADVVFIFNSTPQSNFGILVPDGSDLQTPDQLRGETIGVGTADGAEVGFARAILAANGMSEPADYTFVAVGDGGTATAGFQRGDIAAYVGATSDQAILNQRGFAVRDITPDEFLSFFGNGYATTQSFIDENPEAVEGFGRALVRATAFTKDPANREAVLAHLEAGNPQELEDREFANALLDAVLAKSEQLDPSNPVGYQDPQHWETWHQSLVDTGGLEAPLDDLTAAYTNDFVEAWNEAR